MIVVIKVVREFTQRNNLGNCFFFFPLYEREKTMGKGSQEDSREPPTAESQ